MEKKLHVYRNKSRVGQQLFTATVKTLEELDKYWKCRLLAQL